MLETDYDTIAAIATAPGIGGVGIIRISGPQAKAIGETLCAKVLKPRYAHFVQFKDQDELLDFGIALYFKAPHSFTGEDIVELQGHGGPVVLDRVLKGILQQGARLANAGEFTQRAFLNDKIDLLQAEAIADLIHSQSEQASRAALRSLSGEFSNRIQQLVQDIIYVRTYVEAAIDFVEEEIDFLSDGKVLHLIDKLSKQIQAITAQAKQGVLLQEGVVFVIIGKPNAGKSSLLNALSGSDTAIVTDIAGTTRDLLKQQIQLNGLNIQLIDTAGLRDSIDPIEQEGIRRAKAAMQQADRLLLVIDASNQCASDIQSQWQQAMQQVAIPCTLILNKIDLLTERQLSDLLAALDHLPKTTIVPLSALTTQGLHALTQHLTAAVGFDNQATGMFSARRRHLDALARARVSITNSKQQLLEYQAGELVAEELFQAQQALNEITGQFSADDLLGEIFKNFCIGK